MCATEMTDLSTFQTLKNAADTSGMVVNCVALVNFSDYTVTAIHVHVSLRQPNLAQYIMRKATILGRWKVNFYMTQTYIPQLSVLILYYLNQEGPSRKHATSQSHAHLRPTQIGGENLEWRCLAYACVIEQPLPAVHRLNYDEAFLGLFEPSSIQGSDERIEQILWRYLQFSSLPKWACRVMLNVPVGMLIGDRSAVQLRLRGLLSCTL